MSDLNDKYKEMLGKDPIFDVDQNLNKDLHELNKKDAQSEINKKAESLIQEQSVSSDTTEFEYGEPEPYHMETSKDDVFRIAKNDNSPKKDKMEKSFWELVIARLVIVVIFAIIGAAVCLFMVDQYKPEVSVEYVIDNNTNEIAKPKTQYKKISLNDTYYTNPIKINYKMYMNVSDISGYEFPKIDGLRNETIETKINDRIETLVSTLFNKIKSNVPDAELIHINTYLYSNYNNVLSLMVYANCSNQLEEENYKYAYGSINLTFNLATGEEIFLNDVFAEEYLKNILLQSSYDDLIANYSSMDEETYMLHLNEKAGLVEEEQYELVNDVMNNYKKYPVIITNNRVIIDYKSGSDSDILHIYTNVNGEPEEDDYYRSIDISLYDFYDKVCLFDKANGNNLYDGKYEAVGPFVVFTKSNYAIQKFYEKGNNYVIDYVINALYNDIPKEVKATAITYCNDYISEFIKNAKQDTSHFYVLCGHSYINESWGYFDEETMTHKTIENSYGFYSDFSELVINKNDFDNKVYPYTMNREQKSYSVEEEGMAGIYYRYYDDDYSEESSIYGDITNVNMGIDNLGNIITKDGEDNLPKIED